MKKVAIILLALLAGSAHAAETLEVWADGANYEAECNFDWQEQLPTTAFVSVICVNSTPVMRPYQIGPLTPGAPIWSVQLITVYTTGHEPAYWQWEYCRLVHNRIRPSERRFTLDCRTAGTTGPTLGTRRPQP